MPAVPVSKGTEISIDSPPPTERTLRQAYGSANRVPQLPMPMNGRAAPVRVSIQGLQVCSTPARSLGSAQPTLQARWLGAPHAAAAVRGKNSCTDLCFACTHHERLL